MFLIRYPHQTIFQHPHSPLDWKIDKRPTDTCFSIESQTRKSQPSSLTLFPCVVANITCWQRLWRISRNSNWMPLLSLVTTVQSAFLIVMPEQVEMAPWTSPIVFTRRQQHVLWSLNENTAEEQACTIDLTPTSRAFLSWVFRKQLIMILEPLTLHLVLIRLCKPLRKVSSLLGLLLVVVLPIFCSCGIPVIAVACF